MYSEQNNQEENCNQIVLEEIFIDKLMGTFFFLFIMPHSYTEILIPNRDGLDIFCSQTIRKSWAT